MQKRILVCDSCGIEAEVHELGMWFRVMPLIYEATEETVARMEASAYGDFCSLNCLANWSGMQLSLRELDEEEGQPQ